MLLCAVCTRANIPLVINSSRAPVFIKIMLQTLKLILPALIPSWRFFDVIAPSPRIEFALLKTAQDIPGPWQEFRPRPARLSLGGTIKGLLYNPRWNESLFLASCAERLIENPTEHSRQEILTRIKAEIRAPATTPYLQFRLAFIRRDGSKLPKEIAFISSVYPLEDPAP
jgi:hypothetical protein